MFEFADPAAVVEKLNFIDKVVVFAWVGLTVLMVLSYRQLGDNPWAGRAVLAFIAITWTHPFYATVIRPLGANLFALVALVVVLSIVFSVSGWAGLLLLPTLPWLVAATVYTAARTQLGLTG